MFVTWARGTTGSAVRQGGFSLEKPPCDALPAFGVFFFGHARRDPYSDRRAALTGLDTLHKQRQHQH